MESLDASFSIAKIWQMLAFLLENRDFKDTYEPNEKEIRNTHINIGTGIDISIKELAETIKKSWVSR